MMRCFQSGNEKVGFDWFSLGGEGEEEQEFSSGLSVQAQLILLKDVRFLDL